MSVLSSVNRNLDTYVYETLGVEAVLDAENEFLKKADGEQIELDLDEADAVGDDPLFIEWLWFEYRPPGWTQSLIQTYADQATDLADSVKQELDMLLKTQRYGFWRVGEVVPGRLELIDVARGTSFHVREYSLAKSLQTDDCLFLRLAQQGGHWEVISGTCVPINLPEVHDAEDIAGELTEPVSVKESFGYHQLLRSETKLLPEQSPKLNHTLSLKEARQHFDDMLERCDIARYISRERVEALMKAEIDSLELPAMPTAIRLLIGLIDEQRETYDLELQQVLNASSVLWSALRPKKMRRSKAAPHLSAQKIMLRPWEDAIRKAHDATIGQDSRTAADAWEDVFKQMLDNHGTSSGLYRIYANAGVSNLMNGEMLLGERLLDYAIEICPGYDFALQEKQRLAQGDYEFYMARKLQETLANKAIKLPPERRTVRQWTDDKLIAAFEKLGVTVDKASFEKVSAPAKTLDSLLQKVWNIPIDDKRGDDAYVYALEANRRWTPQVPWPDTLFDIANELYITVFPELPGERRSLKRAKQLIADLTHALSCATDAVIKEWMNGSSDYAGTRVELIEVNSFVRKSRDDAGELLDELFTVAHKRTKDPMYLVPKALELWGHDKPVDKLLKQIADELPMDASALGYFAQDVPDQQDAAVETALLLALKAIDRRKTKHRYTLPPYTYATLQDDYDWILDSLCSYYEETNQLDKAEVYQKRFETVMDDASLAYNPEDEALKKRLDTSIDNEMFSDRASVRYYQWFKTLGIDLSSGDGHETKMSVYEPGGGKLHKVGRNDPCPCGKTKPDGTPVKYKKCHGANM